MLSHENPPVLGAYASRRISRWHSFFLAITPLLLILGLVGLVGLLTTRFLEDRPSASLPAGPIDATALYGRHCSSCHGVAGAGDGPASLEPRARSFGREKFKFASTTHPLYAIPTDADLQELLKRGIPGSSMPDFAFLTDDEREAIKDRVRSLTRAGLYEALWKRAEKGAAEGGDDPDPARIAAQVQEILRSSQPTPLPKESVPSSPESIAAGKKIYLSEIAGCAKCHGTEGRGDGPQTKDPSFKNENGTSARPRDLTQGIFKGGSDEKNLYLRMRLGIPGTPMPQNPSLSDREIQDLVNYVRSLSSPIP